MIADGVTRVDNGPLREAFLRSGMPAYRLAEALGWFKPPSGRWRGRGGPMPDDVRVRAALGLKGSFSRGYGPHYRKTLPHEQALAICRALDLDPVAVGL